MDISKAINDITLYLELYPISDTRTRSAKQIDLPIPYFAAIDKRMGVYAAGHEKNDAMRLVENILEHCSEENLDEMIAAYGEESEIAQIIRRKRSEKYQRKLLSSSDMIEKIIKESIVNSIKSDNPFYQAVCRYIDNKGYRSDADFYNAIGMPRQLFSRIRNPESNLSKKTVLWVIIGLKLDYPAAASMLQLAGFSFKKNNRRDVIISYILRNMQYDIFSVNEILDHFGEEAFC